MNTTLHNLIRMPVAIVASRCITRHQCTPQQDKHYTGYVYIHCLQRKEEEESPAIRTQTESDILLSSYYRGKFRHLSLHLAHVLSSLSLPSFSLISLLLSPSAIGTNLETGHS